MEKINKRQQCHYLVDGLSESALDEVLETLEDILAFYIKGDEYLKNQPEFNTRLNDTAVANISEHVER
jgi:GTP cyclohydrolase III